MTDRSRHTEPAYRTLLSPNHGDRAAPGGIDMLVMHYTGMVSGAAAIERLCDPEAKVSAHYVVEEDGTIWRLVPEERRAFHAGISFWNGQTDLNHVSIGIEIVNPGHQWGYRPFPATQMRAVTALSRGILARHRIPADRVVGHSDIAPDRKTDPGELFDWAALAGDGVGIYPAASGGAGGNGRDPAGALHDLGAIGYPIDPTHPDFAVTAFQRRFRQERCDGVLDSQTITRITEVRQAYDACRRQVKPNGRDQ